MAVTVEQPATVEAAAPGFVPAAGERVLFRERREPPVLAITLTPAVACLLVAGSLVPDSPVSAAAVAVLAAAFVLGGLWWRPRAWVADFAVTDRRVAAAGRNGARAELAWDEVAAWRREGQKVTFVADDGRELPFAFVRGQRKLARAVDAERPDLPFTREIDPLCPT